MRHSNKLTNLALSACFGLAMTFATANADFSPLWSIVSGLSTFVLIALITWCSSPGEPNPGQIKQSRMDKSQREKPVLKP
jgi:hypothetical protein